MTSLDSVLKSRDITLATKSGQLKLSYGSSFFPVVMYRYENWKVKKAEHLRIDAFTL